MKTVLAVGLAGILLLCSGCIIPILQSSGGKATAEAYAFTDTADDSNATGTEKRPALERFVVVTFGVSNKDVFDAWAVQGDQKEIDYPIRLSLGGIVLLPIRYPLESRDMPGAIVLAEGHWPVVLIDDYSSKPSQIGFEVTDPRYGNLWAKIRCFLYPQSKAFDWDISRTAELEWSRGSPSHPPVLAGLIQQNGPHSLLSVVANSKHLAEEDRQMAYRQLLVLAERDLTREKDFGVRAILTAFVGKAKELMRR